MTLKPNRKSVGKVRIIGGLWRSRQLRFTSTNGLRPTPDRVRETLFNWLSPHINGIKCLDLFAGSGSLGFEAVSRGASSITMVDCSISVIKDLRENASQLGCSAVILKKRAMNYLQTTEDTFQLIFIDPPYQQSLSNPILKELEENNRLENNGYVYLEIHHHDKESRPGENWSIIREISCGTVHGFLLQRSRDG